MSQEVSKLQALVKEKDKQLHMLQEIATRYKSHMTDSDKSVRFVCCEFAASGWVFPGLRMVNIQS